jgi:uncharacterized alkaline shock family protein YloU
MTEAAAGVPAQRSDGDRAAESTAEESSVTTQKTAAPGAVAGFGSAGDAEGGPAGSGRAEDPASDSAGFGPAGGAEAEGGGKVASSVEAGAGEAGAGEAGAGEAGAGEAPTALERAQDVVGRVGEQASEVADKVGDAVERAAQASGRVAAAVVDRLRNNAELAAERGSTTIANEVVEKIAGIATREVPGVYDLGGDVARVFAAVKEKIGLGEADEDNRGIRVRLDGNTAAINITIVIEFGFVVHSVTEKVRAKVISSIENLLGLEVTEVNIVVDDVHVDDQGRTGDDEVRAATYQ